MHKRSVLPLHSCPRLPAFALIFSVLAACTPDTDPGIHIDPGTGGSAQAGSRSASGSGGGASVGGMSSSNGGSFATTGGTQSILLPQAGTAGQGTSEHCGAEAHEAKLKPLAMYLLVDQSSSMTTQSDRWTPVSTAIQTFVSDPLSAGIEVAVGYFPASSLDQDFKCDMANYAMPDVGMGVLPDNSGAVVASLSAKVFPVGQAANERTSTPTRPAYQGSVSYLTSWLQQNSDRTGVMVLATDGEPTTCPTNAIADVVRVIRAASTGAPSIKTYVIGIGSEGNLTQFADAGGTGHAPFMVDGTGVNTQADFLAAMHSIRGSALPCDFSVPKSDTGTQDPNKVNVDYQPGAGGAQVGLVRVADKATCADATNAWYYDDPQTPKSILLCPATCALIKSDDQAKVSIALGCDTRVR